MGLLDLEGCYSQFSLNAAKVVEARRSPELHGFLQRATIVNADGQSLVWAGRLLGVPFPERVAGIDLLGALLAAMEREGRSAYFLGARDEVHPYRGDPYHGASPASARGGFPSRSFPGRRGWNRRCRDR